LDKDQQWAEALEQIIRDLIKRKNACPEDSAEQRFYERQLAGLRYTYEEAGGIIEELDRYWGADCTPP
jgi:hypothetical protein